MKIINGGKENDDEDEKPINGQILPLINPWEYEPPFDFHTCIRIKDLARCAPKRAVKVAIFGTKELNEEEQKEFDTYYAEGSAEGEVAIGVQLFSRALGGDNRSIDQYLTLKAHWNKDNEGDDEDEEDGLNIFLSDGTEISK